MKARHVVVGVIAAILSSVPMGALAGSRKFSSDLIASSQRGVDTNHTVTFRVGAAVPISGRIIITPQGGYFTIPAAFDYTDADLATAPALSGPYTERSLAALPSAADDGVQVVSGASGTITITLNFSQGIAAGTFVRMLLGSHAVFGESGDQQITNPVARRSYKLNIETRNAAGVSIDTLNVWVAILDPTTMGPVNTADFDAPIRFNGMPSGSSVNAGIIGLDVSLETDEWAICRYASVPGISYASMTSTFAVTGQFFHSGTVLGSYASGQTYYYYIRCSDYRSNPNTDDYPIWFTIAQPVATPGPGYGRGAGMGGGEPGGPIFPEPGGVPGGRPGGEPFPPAASPPQVTLEGWSYPKSRVTLLQDGLLLREIETAEDGRFRADIGDLKQAVYTFGVWALDTDDRRSIIFNSTFSIIAGTKTLVSNILMPPTIEASTRVFSQGDALEALGQSAPESSIETRMFPMVAGGILENEIATYSTEAGTDGRWRTPINTTQLFLSQYALSARAYKIETGHSVYGEQIFVGSSSGLSMSQRSDINKDGRVNFVDFSILLFYWGKEYPPADINDDGKINLVDFSILLTNWTG